MLKADGMNCCLVYAIEDSSQAPQLCLALRRLLGWEAGRRHPAVMQHPHPYL